MADKADKEEKDIVKAAFRAGQEVAKETKPKSQKVQDLEEEKDVIRLTAEIAALQQQYDEDRSSLTFEEILKIYNEGTIELDAQVCRMHPSRYEGQDTGGWVTNLDPPINIKDLREEVAQAFGGGTFEIILNAPGSKDDGQKGKKWCSTFKIPGKPKLRKDDEEDESGQPPPGYTFAPPDAPRMDEKLAALEERMRREAKDERDTMARLHEKDMQTLVAEIKAIAQAPKTDWAGLLGAMVPALLVYLEKNATAKSSENAMMFKSQVEMMQHQSQNQMQMLSTMMEKAKPVGLNENIAALEGIMALADRFQGKSDEPEDMTTTLVKGTLGAINSLVDLKQRNNEDSVKLSELQPFLEKAKQEAIAQAKQELQQTPPALPRSAPPAVDMSVIPALIELLKTELQTMPARPTWPTFADKLPPGMKKSILEATTIADMIAPLQPHVAEASLRAVGELLSDPKKQEWFIKSFTDWRQKYVRRT